MSKFDIRARAAALMIGTGMAMIAAPAMAQDYAPDNDGQAAYSQDAYPQDAYPQDRYQQDAYGPDYAAQEEDIIVQGGYGRVPDDVTKISQRVSYADLDLRYDEDRRTLRERVSLTARYLCDRLGESRTYSYGPSCREDAVRNATRQVRAIEARWTPRGQQWVRPGRWQAPYPDYFGRR